MDIIIFVPLFAVPSTDFGLNDCSAITSFIERRRKTPFEALWISGSGIAVQISFTV